MALKRSKQRDMIMAFLMERKDHPTADVVYQNVRRQQPNISLGTVYRNLNLLADTGQIQRLRFCDGVEHFDADTTPHCHFFCRKCGRVLDFKVRISASVSDLANADFQGNLEGHVTFFYGTCPGCTGNSQCDPFDEYCL